MLGPPGSASSRARSSARRKAALSPEEELRKMQRLQPNKQCADCRTKIPQCVNLTVGTFICLACSGILREYSHRVKGIGASSFSAEEVQKMKDAGNNEKVNSIWLARYDPNQDRLKAPTDNRDQQLLRLWIRRKYHDKAWYSSEPQPTRVELPPKQAVKATNAVAPAAASRVAEAANDLLGFDSTPSPSSAPAPAGWDAFGGSSQQRQQQEQQHQAQANSFPTNFGSTQTQQRAAAAAPPQQKTFANFGNSTSSQVQQVNDFANFGAAQSVSQVQQKQQQPVTFVAPAPAPNQQSFANFGGSGPSPASANPSQPQLRPQQGFPSFGNMSMQQQPPPSLPAQQHLPQQQQPSSQVPSEGGFANFGNAQAPQRQFGNFPQPQQLEQPGTFANFGAPAPTATPIPTESANTAVAPSQPTAMSAPTPSQVTNLLVQTAVTVPPSLAPAPTASNPVSQQTAIPAASQERADAFSAFDSLSLGPSSAAASATAAVGKTVQTPRYKEQEQASYTDSSGKTCPVKILKVHLDDDLEPFYSIQLPDGREKQTDDAHLKPVDSDETVVEITRLLSTLDKQQLNEILVFVKKLKDPTMVESLAMNATEANNQTPPGETENETRMPERNAISLNNMSTQENQKTLQLNRQQQMQHEAAATNIQAPGTTFVTQAQQQMQQLPTMPQQHQSVVHSPAGMPFTAPGMGGGGALSIPSPAGNMPPQQKQEGLMQGVPLPPVYQGQQQHGGRPQLNQQQTSMSIPQPLQQPQMNETMQQQPQMMMMPQQRQPYVMMPQHMQQPQMMGGAPQPMAQAGAQGPQSPGGNPFDVY